MSAGLLPLAVKISLALLSLALLFGLGRLVRGPSLPDRVVALELISTVVVGLIAVSAILGDEPGLIGPATVLALVGFLATVAFAYYIARGGEP